MRILFAGTPGFAAAHLEALLEDGGCDIVAVYTQPDRASGRGKKTRASPVKVVAERSALAVEQPRTLRDADAQRQLESYRADLMVVVAYGLLLPAAVLNAPRLGCVNVHASLLPRWRGAAPVERAIEAGDQSSGVTIMQMDEGLDTGDMLERVEIPLDARETGDSLREKMIARGAPLLIDVLGQLQRGGANPEKQDDAQASYAHKLDKREALLDFSQSAASLQRRIRAFTSAMPCHAELDGQRIRMFDAHAAASNGHSAGEILAVDSSGLLVGCGEGALRVEKLQLPGKNIVDMAALLNGRPDLFRPGQRFDAQD